MSKRFDIVIVGGGVTGLTVAALLAQCRHSDKLCVRVIDGAARPVCDDADDVALRVSAIATGSAELLESVGAWAHIADTRACAYDHMRVWDESRTADSGTALVFDAAEFAVPQLGFIVENIRLQFALAATLDGSDVQLDFEAPLARLEPHGHRYSVALESGETFDADLIIGADGARSWVRDCAGIGTDDFPYGQTALVTHLQPERPHQNTAWQRFLRDGPLGILPLHDGRVSVVWSTLDSTCERAMRANDVELGDMLGAASDHVLGELTVAGPRGAFPLRARHAHEYVRPGIALIGDAAHAVHPLAGQGANLGLQDAAELAAVIDAALDNGEHPGDRPVLRRYERARKGDNATMMHFISGLNRLFATDSSVIRELRAAGMRLFNVSGPIRDRAVRVALGMAR